MAKTSLGCLCTGELVEASGICLRRLRYFVSSAWPTISVQSYRPDRIWTVLGDTARDFNWYSKRATLSGVYSSTVLYWLGDDSLDHQATWEFLDRRIEDVMRFEKTKAKVRENPLLKRVFAGPEKVLGSIRAPRAVRENDLPGGWTAPR